MHESTAATIAPAEQTADPALPPVTIVHGLLIRHYDRADVALQEAVTDCGLRIKPHGACAILLAPHTVKAKEARRRLTAFVTTHGREYLDDDSQEPTPMTELEQLAMLTTFQVKMTWKRCKAIITLVYELTDPQRYRATEVAHDNGLKIVFRMGTGGIPRMELSPYTEGKVTDAVTKIEKILPDIAHALQSRPDDTAFSRRQEKRRRRDTSLSL